MSGGYRAALAAEALKARRSKMPLLTFIAMSAAGLIAALFMFILVNPARAQRLGLLNEKAHLSGLTADWAGLLSFLAQIVAVGDGSSDASSPTVRCATSWPFPSLAPPSSMRSSPW